MSGIFVFITNASFIYLQYFQVGELWFPVFFGINILFMMVFTLITTRLVRTREPYRLFVAARGIQLGVLAGLAVLVSVIDPPLWPFTLMLALAVGSAGMITPSISGLYLTYFDRLSGSAVSLMNVTVFLFGSGLGVLSGVYFDGSLQPMVYTMFAAAFVANVIAATIPAPERG